jgi:hypothetical protein
MNTIPEHDERIAKMSSASVCPHDIKKVEGKGRTKEKFRQFITWFTGFDEIKITYCDDTANKKIPFYGNFFVVYTNR